MRSLLRGPAENGASGGRERGSYLWWRARGEPRCCCRPCSRSGSKATLQSAHQPRVGTAENQSFSINTSEEVLCKYLKSHEEKVRPQFLSLPPTRPMRTVSPCLDRARKAQEFGRVSWMAVHLGPASEARNHSLTSGFLCGRSLGPFGTHFAFGKRISGLASR
jgi:hypothetical protein